MSYQVIARKWRPQTFEEVTGQESITRTLRNGIEHERLHHAYLFSGARGVGKTTTARLLAKALNCHKTEKPNPRPCAPMDAEPMCVSCAEIAEGRSIDVLEIDAASNTGVDNVREVIINNLGIAPARDRYKVFIIDEVHMLSASSFNALLKSVEEPPPRVVFIMATTELHKVPDTILSRCQEFEFRTISTTKIFERLKLIADAEKIAISDAALREVARSGEGSMRDAQSNFDQVISFSSEKIEVSDVMNALGLASTEMLSQTISAIAERNAGEILRVVEDLTRRGQDLRNFCRDLLAHLRDLLVAKIAGGQDELFDSAAFSREELFKQNENFTEADLIRFFNSLSETEAQIPKASQPRYILEIGLIKLIEMRRVASIEKILERLTELESALSNDNLPSANKVENVSKPIELADFVEPPAEKKTLKPDFPVSEFPFPVKTIEIRESSPENTTFPISEPFAAEKKFSEIKSETKFSEVKLKNEVLPVAFDTNSFFVKLPPITSEELEHVEDNWLDTSYEEQLLRAGDSLNIIAGASVLASKLLGANNLENESAAKFETNASNGAAAFAPAKTAERFASPVAQFEPEKISEELPVLPENPTEAELLRYAENHPQVKLAMRIFRAKIIGVTQKK